MMQIDLTDLLDRANLLSKNLLRGADKGDAYDLNIEIGNLVRELVENVKVLAVEVERLEKDNAEAQAHFKEIRERSER